MQRQRSTWLICGVAVLGVASFAIAISAVAAGSASTRSALPCRLSRWAWSSLGRSFGFANRGKPPSRTVLDGPRYLRSCLGADDRDEDRASPRPAADPGEGEGLTRDASESSLADQPSFGFLGVREVARRGVQLGAQPPHHSL